MSSSERIQIISATRLDEAAFAKDAPLGQSSYRLRRDRRIEFRVAPQNTTGLPTIYNRRIDADDGPDILVFVHDDVWIEDYYLVDRVAEALGRFDIVGVAGNTRRLPGQTMWAFPPGSDRFDLPHLSGGISAAEKFGRVWLYGTTPAECELLDGVFLAARRSTLRKHGVRFDPAFDFHFYDLDFCRSARAAGLKLGTWPIVLGHRSGGGSSPAWGAKRDLYLAKWSE